MATNTDGKKFHHVIFEEDEDGVIVATVPAIPGCYTQGDTIEEATERVAEAIQVCSMTMPTKVVTVKEIEVCQG